MVSSTTLKGIELIDCARANAKHGIEVASRLCGYENDQTAFQAALQEACDRIGIRINELEDLVKPVSVMRQRDGIEFAPDTENLL